MASASKLFLSVTFLFLAFQLSAKAISIAPAPRALDGVIPLGGYPNEIKPRYKESLTAPAQTVTSQNRALMGANLSEKNELFWDDGVKLSDKPDRASSFQHTLYARSRYYIFYEQPSARQFVDPNRGNVDLLYITSKDLKTWSTPHVLWREMPYNKPNLTPLYTTAVTKKGDIYVVLRSDMRHLVLMRKLQDRKGTLPWSRRSPLSLPADISLPRLFPRSNSSFTLFFYLSTQVGRPIPQIGSAAALFFTDTTNKGKSWRPALPLLKGKQHIDQLTNYSFTVGRGKDYLAFEAQRASTEQYNGREVFLMSRISGSPIWSSPKTVQDITKLPFDGTQLLGRILFVPNSRTTRRDFLTLFWVASLPPKKGMPSGQQVYYMTLSPQLSMTSHPKRMTSQVGLPMAVYDLRPFLYNGRANAVWVTTSPKITIFYGASIREGKPLLHSLIPTYYPVGPTSISTLPTALYGLSLFRGSSDRYHITFEAPGGKTWHIPEDTKVQAPQLTNFNPASHPALRSESLLFSWDPIKDPAGISDYQALVLSQKVYKKLSLSNLSELLKNSSLGASRLDYETIIPKDGNYVFLLQAIDKAGNRSPILTVFFYRDATPPQAPVISPIARDAYGNLASSSVTFSWAAPKKDGPSTLLGYDYDLSLISSPRDLETLSPLSGIVKTRFLHSAPYVNIPDGEFVFRVQAIDRGGNKGTMSALYFSSNKHITPLQVTSAQATPISGPGGSYSLSISGTGLSQFGTLQAIFLDRDGRLPYDYTLFLNRDFKMASQNSIVIPKLPFRPRHGTYFLYLSAPGIGAIKAQVKVRFSGLIFPKAAVLPLSRPLFEPQHVMSLAPMIVYPLLGGVLLLIFILPFWYHRYAKERETAYTSSRALWERGPLPIQISDALKRTKRKRNVSSIRGKISLLSTAVVLVVGVLFSLGIGYTTREIQRRNYFNTMISSSQIFLGSIESSVQGFLLTKDTASLSLIPGQVEKLTGARWITVLGPGAEDPKHFNYVWASNDPSISRKMLLPLTLAVSDISALSPSPEQQSLVSRVYSKDIFNTYTLRPQATDQDKKNLRAFFLSHGYFKTIVPGYSRVSDNVTKRYPIMTKEIDSQILRSSATLTARINSLSSEIQKDLTQTKTTGQTRELQTELTTSQNQLLSKYQAFQKIPRAIPNPTRQSFTASQKSFLFYYPVLYRSNNDTKSFRGVIQLSLGTQQYFSALAIITRFVLLVSAVMGALAILLGAFASSLLAHGITRPIQVLISQVTKISLAPDLTALPSTTIKVHTKDELGSLAASVNTMTEGLIHSATQDKELRVGKELQKNFLPLKETSSRAIKSSISELQLAGAEFAGYYEGAKGVSGDYFNFHRITDDEELIIKCDVSGKGVSASLIMVEVATLFVSYAQKAENKGIKDLTELAYEINTLLGKMGFEGRFAAIVLILMNTKTGDCRICNAGDREMRYYRNGASSVDTLHLPVSPAAGVFDSDMVRNQPSAAYKEISFHLNPGDVIFLVTDGLEEAQHQFRDSAFHVMHCQDRSHTEQNVGHSFGEKMEELSFSRIDRLLVTGINGGDYTLIRQHDPAGLPFNFHVGEALPLLSALLLVIGAEKLFRVIKQPTTSLESKITIDQRVDAVLKDFFVEYWDYFRFPLPDGNDEIYRQYRGLSEDPQYDDLTILGIRKT